nr:leucine-rich glioma-inactivated protein 1-like [Megalopta genalis]
MRSKLFHVLLFVAERVVAALAICTVTRHEGDFGDRVQCQNTSLAALANVNSSEVAALMIFQSNLAVIPGSAFARFSGSLNSLNIHMCRLRNISADAFHGLAKLKKLSLPNNNISSVKEEWFKDTVYLEQLDLSYNRIDRLNPAIFSRMLLLKRLDVRENRLTCLDWTSLPGGIEKVYFFGNPLTFLCRGKLTLWMRDHGVSYKTGASDAKEAWLDKLLWLCAIDDSAVAGSELLIKECLLLNLFEQLKTGLTTAESYPLQISYDCADAMDRLMVCAAKESEDAGPSTNARFVTNLLLYLREARSS